MCTTAPFSVDHTTTAVYCLAPPRQTLVSELQGDGASTRSCRFVFLQLSTVQILWQAGQEAVFVASEVLLIASQTRF
jgi:hypothetical protein